jgi:hypothetical protein
VVPPRSDRISRVPPYSRIDWNLRIRGCHPLRPAFPDHSASRQSTTGLFRFRSPLLAESLLMSVPPGTEMFQFPGFASNAYVFSARYPSRGGLPHSDIHGSTPARGSPWLFAACHVLHRLLVPRHPPNALLMLESIRIARRVTPTTNPTPCTGTIPGQHGRERSRMDHAQHTSPLNPPWPRDPEAPLARKPQASGQTCDRARPETHQNLIHHFQRTRHPKAPDRPAAPGRSILRTLPRHQPDHATGLRRWWRRSGSNRRPPACKAGALPAELRPQQ